MSWDNDSWAAFVSLLQRGFAARDPMSKEDVTAYRVLLDGVEPAAAMDALRELVLEGQELRPRPGAIAKRIRTDRSAPTFEEALRLIYGPRGVLTARPSVRTWPDEQARRRAYDEAAIARARELHPLIGTFVARQDFYRLRTLPINDAPMHDRDQRAAFARKELREAWERHVAATDGREVAALASGGDTRHQLRRLDPLTAIPGHTRPALTQGDPA